MLYRKNRAKKRLEDANLLLQAGSIDDQERYSKLLSQKKSGEVILGQITEQLAPFLDAFPYDPHKVKFMGMPIDYICFEDDKIIFLEVKSGKSHLSPKQSNIKKLILDKQVYWEEFRVPYKVKV